MKKTDQVVPRSFPAPDEAGDAGDAGEHEEEGERDDAATAQVKPERSVEGLSQKNGKYGSSSLSLRLI